MLDKTTGKLQGEEGWEFRLVLFHSNWSSAAFGKNGDQDCIVFGAGMAGAYGFDTKTTKSVTAMSCQGLWRYDLRSPNYRMKDGQAAEVCHSRRSERSDRNAGLLQGPRLRADWPGPEHGERTGNFSCFDATKTGDITTSGKSLEL